MEQNKLEDEKDQSLKSDNVDENVVDESEDIKGDEKEEEIKGEVKEKIKEESKDEKDFEKQICELKDKNVRLQAEYQNFRRRVEKEKADIYKFANEKLVIELLGVMDNIDRAINSINVDEANKNIVDGVQLIKKTMDDFLIKNNVKVIEAVGKEFDPEKHHAVMTAESDEHEESTVMEEFQKGYELNGKVVRPSMVKVSK